MLSVTISQNGLTKFTNQYPIISLPYYKGMIQHLKMMLKLAARIKSDLLVGRHLQKEAGLTAQSILTMPILEGLLKKK